MLPLPEDGPVAATSSAVPLLGALMVLTVVLGVYWAPLLDYTSRLAGLFHAVGGACPLEKRLKIGGDFQLSVHGLP